VKSSGAFQKNVAATIRGRKDVFDREEPASIAFFLEKEGEAVIFVAVKNDTTSKFFL
jgi:hypothetical protein